MKPDYEKIASKVALDFAEFEKLEPEKDEKGRVNGFYFRLNQTINKALEAAHASGIEEGMRKVVLARTPSFDEYMKQVQDSYGYPEDYEWLLSQLGPLEVRLPERKLINEGDSPTNRRAIGFNEALDKIREMNTELFGEKVK
jgi:hypothetical protein